MAQLAEVSTRMARDFVVPFLVFMAILLAGEKGWHTRDDVVVIVVMVEHIYL